MRCPKCNFGNSNGMRFCGQCGTQLNIPCPQCGFTNPGGFAFCGQCGTPLSGQSPVQGLESSVQSPESKTAALPDPRRETIDPRSIDYIPSHLADRIRAATVTDGERKTITAVFADLKGSTALIEGSTPKRHEP